MVSGQNAICETCPKENVNKFMKQEKYYTNIGLCHSERPTLQNVFYLHYIQ